MNKREKFLFILLSLALLPFLVNPIYSAYGTLNDVILSAPSSANVGQQIQVQATVSAKRTG